MIACLFESTRPWTDELARRDIPRSSALERKLPLRIYDPGPGSPFIPGVTNRLIPGDRLIFVPDATGELVNVARYRPGRKPKYLTLCGTNHSFYGANVVYPRRPRTIYLTEGYFDVWHALARGYDCVGIMGTHPSKELLAGLPNSVERVVLALDADRGGEEGIRAFIKVWARTGGRRRGYCPAWRLEILELPHEKDDVDEVLGRGITLGELPHRAPLDVLDTEGALDALDYVDVDYVR